ERGAGARARRRAAGGVRRLGRRRRRSARDGDRAAARRAQAALANRRRGGRDRPRGAERGVRLAEPGRDPRARPRRGARERQRRRDRARPPTRDERRAPRGDAPARAPPPRRPLRARDALRRGGPGPGGAIRTLSPARRYVELALALGEHVEELVMVSLAPWPPQRR